MRKLLEHEPRLTRSKAERRMLRLIREAGLPAPETNVRIAGWEVDLLWREQSSSSRSTAGPSTRRADSFERDRRKEVDLVAAGLRVSRVTCEAMTAEALGVAARLATALAA